MNELKRKRNKTILWFCLSLLLILSTKFLFADSKTAKTRIMFYNVENLFDIEDDSLTLDEEFLPTGDRNWNSKKFYLKLKRIYQVIMAAGEGNLPAVVGLCEIENQNTLERLLHFTPLENLGYSFIHKESPDPRGIDVALLYNKKLFRPISYSAIPVINNNDYDFRTRDILYVKGTIQTDTIHCFINHWPSKYGGLLSSQPNRELAARILKHNIDSLLKINQNNKIILMGDFNDSPFDKSIDVVLDAKTISEEISLSNIYNLARDKASQGIGSNKYQETWEMIDQMMVSGSLLMGQKLHTNSTSFKVFNAPFLIEKDKTNLGNKPFRTYIGYKYHNGFSDHLPIVVDLYSTVN